MIICAVTSTPRRTGTFGALYRRHRRLSPGRYAEAAERLAPVAAGADGAMKQSAYLFIGQSLFCSRATAMPPSWHSIRPSKCRRRQGRGGGRLLHNYISARLDGAAVPFGDAAATFESSFAAILPVPMPSVWPRPGHIYIADHDYDRAIGTPFGHTAAVAAHARAASARALQPAWNAIGSHDYVAADAHLNDAAAIDGDASGSRSQGIAGHYGHAARRQCRCRGLFPTISAVRPRAARMCRGVLSSGLRAL